MAITKETQVLYNFLESLDSFGIGIYICTSDDFSLLYANNKFLSDYNIDRNDPKIRDTIRHISQTNESLRKETGQYFINRSTSLSWPGVEGNKLAVLYMQIDISNSVKVDEGKPNYVSYENSIIKMPNRNALVKDLSILLNDKKEDYELIALNLNFFSRINFTYGYEYGNVLILKIVNFLRKFDGVARLYSMSGAKYLLLMHKDFVPDFTRDIRDRFKSSWKADDIEQFLSFSIGIVKIDDFGDTPDGCIYKASFAATEAITAGNNVSYYKPSGIEDLIKNTQLEYYLRKSVNHNMQSFFVYYQPIIEFKTGKIGGYEALCRWSDEELGFVYPSEFIGLAEYIGVINLIDLHVLKNATQFTKKLHDLGHYIKISVNISLKALFQDNIVEDIRDIINESQIEFSYVNIEITESNAVSNLKEVVKKIVQLKSLGIGVHLDDFGVGYSSLSVLQDIPVTTIKIDRKFIMEMSSTKYCYTFVKSIIDLAHSANMKVCGEGVETKEDYEELCKLKCDLLQGYYFSPALSEKEALNFVKKAF